jgi:hypothetical protein
MRREAQQERGRPDGIHLHAEFAIPGSGEVYCPENSRLRNLTDGQTS